MIKKNTQLHRISFFTSFNKFHIKTVGKKEFHKNN